MKDHPLFAAVDEYGAEGDIRIDYIWVHPEPDLPISDGHRMWYVAVYDGRVLDDQAECLASGVDAELTAALDECYREYTRVANMATDDEGGQS